MEIEPRYTIEEQQKINDEIENTIKKEYSRGERQEVRDFVEGLEKRIEESRECFFWSADNASERRQNEEVRDKEKRGDELFDYGSAIHTLVFSLVSIDSNQRRKIMQKIKNGINYTIRGIEVNTGHLEECQGYVFPKKPFFIDVASSPLKYFS